jgi:hypothetical protein
MITLRERFSGRLGHTHSYLRPCLIRLATCLTLASVFQWPEPAAASLIGDTVSLSQDLPPIQRSYPPRRQRLPS